jgi:hypothetical protein
MQYKIHIKKHHRNCWEAFYEDDFGTWEIGLFSSQAKAIAAREGFEKGYQAHQAHLREAI